MRFAVIAVALPFVANLGCDRAKSKLDDFRGAEVDALWDLAPEGTQMGVVIGPHAINLGFRAIAAVRELSSHPDLAPARGQLDALLTAMFGSPTGSPEDAGFARNRGFAMFDTGDGVIGVMPVADRVKFMESKDGTLGKTEDKLDDTTCRMIGQHYVCTTNVAMFDRMRTGKLRSKLALAGKRGDAELYMAKVPLLGANTGELAVAATLEAGQLSITGRWAGTPDGPLEKIAGIAAPKPDTEGASGFVAVNLAPLIASLPTAPVAGGITLDQLGKSLAGPVTAMIPAGSVDIQVFAPLTDAKPAQTVIDNCKEVETWFQLAPTQKPGACRLLLQGTNALELDMWVEGNTLRLGANKGPKPRGKPGAMTAAGRELASGNWTAAFWGRGTMLNLTGIKPATEEVSAEVALGIHTMAVVNELGAGVRVDKDGVRFRAIIRTAWANPKALADKLVTIGGNDIITGKATESAKAIAAGAPGSLFAADYDAGQGGLMVPAAMVGLASAVLLPAIARMVAGEDEGPPPGVDQPMQEADLMKLLLQVYVEEAYPKWAAKHPNQKCPATLDEIAAEIGEDAAIPVKTDAWGHALVLKCDASGFKILSVGPDGKEGTDDDIRSW